MLLNKHMVTDNTIKKLLWFSNNTVEHSRPVNKSVVSRAESLLVDNSLLTEENLAVIKNKDNRNSKGLIIASPESSLFSF